MKRVAFTGSAGFLGQALWKAFADEYALRLCDIADFDAGPNEKCVGDVSDPAFCERVVQDCDAVVIAHMSPRPNNAPYGPFNANVTGTANLVYAGHHAGVRRFCLISSSDAVSGYPADVPRTPDLPGRGRDIYTATKACQEIVARAAHVELGMACTVMRIGRVVDLEAMTDKYNHDLPAPKPGMIDRYDCGIACRKALEQDDLSFQVFYVYSVCDAEHRSEGLATYRALDWTPARPSAGTKAWARGATAQ